MTAFLGINTECYARALAASSAMLLMSAAVDASPNLFTNGSFESPRVPAGKLTNFASGSTDIAGWTVAGAEASLVDSTFSSFSIQFPASDGSQWLDLTGFLASIGETIKQTAPTVVGRTYYLSFAVGNVFNRHGIYGTRSTVVVTVNGAPLGTFTNSCTTCTNKLTWETFTASFVADSATTVIEFLNKDPSTDNCNGLDDVVLTEGSGGAT
jgi:hypothetical protein